MSDLAAYFNDPLNPARSLQLNSRFWKGDTYRHLDMLREADDDVNHLRLRSLRKTLQPVKSLLPPHVRRAFLSRLVYSIVYSTSFAPLRFSLQLSAEFLRANSYDGPDNEAYKSARHTEELRYIVDLVHSIYRGHYGRDVLSSTFAVRYMNASNSDAVRRMTQHGDLSDFHLDQGKDFTCIIYLCPVNSENGCFTYIDGSSAVRKSHILRALHLVADFDLGLETPEQRSHLPLELRGSVAFGAYLDDEKRDRVRRAAVEVVGNAGDGIIFNGFDTIHRGGKPLANQRTALFISTRGHINLRLKEALYAQLAHVCW